MRIAAHNAQGSWKAFPSPMSVAEAGVVETSSFSRGRIIYLSVPDAALFWGSFENQFGFGGAHARIARKGLSLPGSREFLYSGEITPSTHGRQPGTLASVAMHREKKTRAVLAELGIPPESAAVSLKAAKEALLRVMPDSKAKAMSPADLFQAAVIPSRTTGNRALRELLSAGKIERIGELRKGYSCRYFKRMLEGQRYE